MCGRRIRGWSKALSESGGKEGFGGGLQGGQARTAAWSLRLGSGEEASDLTKLSPRRADDGCSLVEPLCRLTWRKGKTRLLPGAAHRTHCLTRARECVAFVVHEAFDLEGHLDIASAIEALAGSALAWLELRKLRFPEAQDVGLDFADTRDVANFEIETVRDDGFFVDALGGQLRGHNAIRAQWKAPFVKRSIGQCSANGSTKISRGECGLCESQADYGVDCELDSGRTRESRAGECGGAARRYWTGQLADSPRAAAACRGQ